MAIIQEKIHLVALLLVVVSFGKHEQARATQFGAGSGLVSVVVGRFKGNC
jgi:hypothetical protein